MVLLSWCHFLTFASLAPAGHCVCVSAVWCCFGVCLLPSLEPSDQPAVTCVLGATRTLLELLGGLQDPGSSARGLSADTTACEYLLALPPSSKWNQQVECISVGRFVLRLAEVKNL